MEEISNQNVQFAFIWWSKDSNPLSNRLNGCSQTDRDQAEKVIGAAHRYALLWCHNGHNGVSNNQPHDCLLNRLFKRRSKKTSKLRVTGLCAGNSPVTGEFPAQMTSNVENISIWWRLHGLMSIQLPWHHCQNWTAGFPGDMSYNPLSKPRTTQFNDIKFVTRPTWRWHDQCMSLNTRDCCNYFSVNDIKRSYANAI